MEASAECLVLGSSRVMVSAWDGLGLVIDGAADGTPSNYLDAVFDDALARETFFSLVDTHGLVVCKNLDLDPEPYRFVGGNRGQGKLSQGEYFHHDGCSTPIKPRINEIRCPDQRVVRTMLTSIAPFSDVVTAMLLELPTFWMRDERLRGWRETAQAGEPVRVAPKAMQGRLNRAIRALDPEDARGFFMAVDQRVGAYAEPWSLRESRFMANDNPLATVQHRRACYLPWEPGTPNGHLLKRWPAEELPLPL
ncbi:MAG: hypothetical protein ACJATT_005269 [Myxococcota bacterium]|jgi:hypothetical protein